MRQLIITLVAITAMLAGFYLSARHFSEPIAAPQTAPGGTLLGSIRPDFQLASNTGEFVSPADFSGKTILINFWATWCAPCRQEMPMLMDLQRQYGSRGLQVIGIALDDVQSVMSFVDTYGISYPILVGSEDVFTTSAAYGNEEGVLPYSVLVDKTGVVRWHYAGIIQHGEISNLLSDLL
ncbi:MAG: TlpA disulfide reductase family protein [Lysobacterales bacterium]|jgi:thiol-disulfide isomerase/thioredoxin